MYADELSIAWGIVDETDIDRPVIYNNNNLCCHTLKLILRGNVYVLAYKDFG